MSDDSNNVVPAISTPIPPTSDDTAPGSVPTAQAILGTPVPVQPIAGGRRHESVAGLTQVEAPLEQGQPVESAPQTTQEAVAEIPTQPETEKSVELGPELEKFVEQTEKQADKQPPETVVSAETMPASVPKTIKKPIVVLPLTQKKLQGGQKRGLNTSIRWLAEWCVRQIKKFSSVLVVYRENE